MKRHRTWVEVSERALTNNIETLRSLLEDEARFCAVVKANAYGHGLTEVASIAARAGVDAFAVDSIDDALLLREIYPGALILTLGFTLSDRFREALSANIHLTISDQEEIEQAQSVGRELARTFPLHLKVETGTMRQGASLPDLADMALQLSRCDRVSLEGVSTHFANIEDSENPEFAAHQFSLYEQALAIFAEHQINPPWRHTACSAAIILYPQTHQTLVRAGISMYGIWSSELVENTVRRLNLGCDLQPVLTWKSRIGQIKTVPMGTPIGYGLTEVMKRSGRLAVVPVGYWDGYDRQLSSKGEVLVKGIRCKVMGRVCMNMMMVDVSQVPQLQKEDEVILLGTDGRHRVTAENHAQLTQTIPYEVLTRIHPSIPRVIV
ncbi:alanine racemase [Candidatus Uhrbacteria bacterium]|nr:alanine racemase [Candidatus Uhrbacteria bacterium]